MPNGNSHYAKNINFGKAMNENIPKEIHAAGTWTYIILTASL